MLNDTSSATSLVKSRRSGKPRDLVAPGPDAATLRTILEAAIRTPDHGKLAPWRFVIIDSDRRDQFAELLTTAYRAEKPDAGRLEIEAMDAFARQAPALVAVLSTPLSESHIPRWEQELSAGAACMNLLMAVHAHGFAGGWLTGWPAYSGAVRDALAGRELAKDVRIAGFVFIGTPAAPPAERPRPVYEEVVRHWQ